MWRIKTITGTIIESSRFTSKPMHWHERPVCNERRELWLDMLVLAVWAIVGCICAAVGWLGLSQMLGGALAYLFLAIACRGVYRKRLRKFVDDALNELSLMRVVRPLRKMQER